MTSFAQNLNHLRSGGISLDDLLVEVDQILAGPDSPANATRLLDTLTEENARNPLPSEACTALRAKLEPLTQTGGQRPAAQPATAHLSQAPTPGSTGERLYAIESGASPAEVGEIKTTGDVLNQRFELEECLGSGGMSTVYKATDRRKVEADDRNPYVAVKVLNLEFRAHPSSLIALQREAKKCQSLAHPNIVRVYDFDRDGSTVYMTMEHLSGVSLARKLGASGFEGMPPDEALRIVNDVGKALSFAHEFGIVHADFKPANVFVTDSGKVKVIDFGIARAFHKEDATVMEATRFDAGSLGALTPTYASPEMFEHLEPDPRDDIYALACTAYEMLTGRHPFGRVQANAARDGGLQLQHHKALTWSQFRALKHALEFDRAKRTPTVGQFLKEINRKVAPNGRLLAFLGVLALVMIGAVSGSLYYLVKPEAGDAAAKAERKGPGALETQPPDAGSPTASLPPVAGPATVPGRDTPRPAPPVSQAPVTEPASTTEALSPAELTSLLADAPCSALRGTIGDDAVQVTGYARRLDIRGLENSLSRLVGSKRLDLSGVVAVSQNQCAVLERLSRYWTHNQGLSNPTSISTNKEDDRFMKGENLILSIETPPYRSFVYVDYYSLDGNVVHMLPSPRFRENQAPPSYRATIGDLGEWTVAEPFGVELIAILTTPEPLFEAPRKEYESQAQYLEVLEQRLAELAKKDAANPAVADFVIIKTGER